MQEATEAFKQAFLKQMLLGFHASAMNWPPGGVSVQERKSAVKLSADAAMAASRGSRRWTRGLIAVLGEEERNRDFLRVVLGDQYGRLTGRPNLARWSRISPSKKIVRRSIGRLRAKKNWPPVSDSKRRGAAVARSLLEKRTQVLRGLVPGAASLDGSSLLDETLDYVVSLRAQVDLMQKLVNKLETSNMIRSQKNERKLTEEEAAHNTGKWEEGNLKRHLTKGWSAKGQTKIV